MQPLEAHCNILILQHPNEYRKYYSTAKLVLKGITNARLLRGIEFDAAVLRQTLAGQSPYLLFPTKDATDCEEIILNANHTIIAIDGTWDEARKIVHRNPALRDFPCLTFKRALRSNYRIRKQPQAHCLSTIESIAHLLKLNALACAGSAKSNSYDSLLVGFTKMVEQQLKSIPEHRAN